MQLYTDDNRDTFPAHRNQGLTTADENLSLTNWWGATIVDYARNQTNLYHCPSFKGRRMDNGLAWSWAFDCHRVGYGYNAFFLGIHPYGPSSLTVGGVLFDTAPWCKRSSIVSPAENLLISDAMPRSDGMWSSSDWWPNACMDRARSTSQGFEGVDILRHLGTGVVVFNDGHSEARKNEQINPPVDPGTGNAAGLKNSRFWDPRRRSPQ